MLWNVWTVNGVVCTFSFMLKNTISSILFSIRGNAQNLSYCTIRYANNARCSKVSAWCFQAQPHFAKKNFWRHSVLFLLLYCVVPVLQNGFSIPVVWCLVDTLQAVCETRKKVSVLPAMPYGASMEAFSLLPAFTIHSL